MRRTTQAEIDDMRARGFDAETIRQAEFSEKRTAVADSLCDKVAEAFANVKLGDGVGLFEGQAIDNYETAEVRQQMRKKDEKEVWSQIESKHLNACHSSLSFFDSLGMRFHLPAFIVADLKGDYGMGMEFTLTHLDDYNRKKFGLLSPQQRQVVREYLQFLRQDPDSEFYYDDIDRALNEYWKELE
ncbi:DUF6714 family protein [Sulfuriroseicoccus oceanibius]|uniref:Uncharacterized protein n=1 Tax=Sulfuriroseicoccus oceanibius TaxID=2707525 RepID=A0A6B3L7V4_9BACT|nr:DUF6714 family protein [Sulfuriroseicoccus oceanibius]QQL44614.1 hypothetical protein G3M56_012085 [Sulfuriroseicoccus oceanibius]